MLKRLIYSALLVFIFVSLSIALYLQRDRLWYGLHNTYIKLESVLYPPCTRPISYRLGEFSDKFGISQDQFIGALYEAEKIWEDASGRDLFLYHEDGDLVVNLMYDARQQTTDALKNIDVSLDQSRASYELLKKKYDEKYVQYEQLRLGFEASTEQYESKSSAYEQQVTALNKRGGANEAQYARLEVIRKELNQLAASLRTQQQDLQVLSRDINALVEELNRRARDLNMAVDRYNTVGGAIGEEFDGGVYRVDQSGRAIDVFQFDSYQQLVRLLAHELGHALGIDHVDDPDAIMYRLNQSPTLVLSGSDMAVLRAVCRIE